MAGRIRVAAIAIALVVLMGTALSAKADGVDTGSRVSRGKASQRALEKRIEQLEEQNRALENQNRTIQSELSAQKQAIESLKQQLQTSAQPVANLQAQVPQIQKQVADLQKRQSDLPFEVGFRTGWGESPYSMPGGFFYSAFLNHRLLTQEDGIPGGFVSGELMAGVIMGNHAVTAANLANTLLGGSSSTWINTVEIQPTVQYHLDPASVGLKPLSFFKPYVLAGPSMWISLLSTPVVVKGSQPGRRFRHEDADFQGGGVYGMGFELSLSGLQIGAIQSILDKSFVGAEWRYNNMANGESFQQYSGSVSFGW